MKFFILAFFLVLALAEDDGKYKPEATTATQHAVPVVTTVRPVTRWNDPRWGLNAWNDPTKYNPYNPTWNRATTLTPEWNRPGYNRWDTRYNVDAAGRPINNRFNDWRTVRLDEKADARGYVYDYETVGGVLVQETGTFENIGLRHEGIRAVGTIQITDRDGVIYKINYQSESKEAYVPRGAREPDRVPPSIARALALLESHK